MSHSQVTKVETYLSGGHSYYYIVYSRNIYSVSFMWKTMWWEHSLNRNSQLTVHPLFLTSRRSSSFLGINASLQGPHCCYCATKCGWVSPGGIKSPLRWGVSATFMQFFPLPEKKLPYAKHSAQHFIKGSSVRPHNHGSCVLWHSHFITWQNQDTDPNLPASKACVVATCLWRASQCVWLHAVTSLAVSSPRRPVQECFLCCISTAGFALLLHF